MLLIPSSATDELWPRALLVGLLAGVGLGSFFFKPTRRAGQVSIVLILYMRLNVC